MLVFPPLPTLRSQTEWPTDIADGYRHLQGLFQRAKNLASLNNPDPVRAQLLVSDIFGTWATLLLALAEQLPNEKWVTDCAAVLFSMGAQVREAANAVEGQSVCASIFGFCGSITDV